jgi:hypothetical protein
MNAIEAAVLVMATPDSPVPLQARSELLTGLAAAYSAQKATSAFDVEDTEALLRWCNAFARYPLGADDVTPVPGVLPPVQKLVLQLLGQLSPVSFERPGLMVIWGYQVLCLAFCKEMLGCVADFASKAPGFPVSCQPKDINVWAPENTV